ncbi:MAG: asparagine synthase (glutamine-hydrolyzing) [Candidatus Omnitrophota bacterium]|jgi:asparagine synthase (glutamine-hydrolysing)
MCGICGFAVKKLDFDARERLMSMNGPMVRRGPDEEGYFLKDGAGLAVRRLSIVDLSGGSQPIHNENKDIWVTANAEIYNFHDLAERLRSKGHKFYTKSDVEVIAHAYEEWGVDFLGQVRGMFAISIWDDRLKCLILARDRFGIKPLVYMPVDDGIYFSSEIRSLEACRGPDLKLDAQSLYMYLSFNYVVQPRTIYEGVKCLQPAHYLVYKEGKIEERRYWDAGSSALARPGGKQQKEDEVDSAIDESVKAHLIGDVPIGIFLSGGIDSSIVLRHFSRHQDNIPAFSVGFSEPSHDETRFARIVSERYGAEHFVDIIDGGRFLGEFPEIVSGLDEPFADSSMVGVHFLAKMANKRVKVVLTGEGGDEVFGGYDTYIADAVAPYYRMLPGFIKNAASGAAGLLPVTGKKVGLDEKLRRFVKFADLEPSYSHLYWRRIFDDRDIRQLASPEIANEKTLSGLDDFYRPYFERSDRLKGVYKYKYLDLNTYLPSDMLTKVDRMCMANSVEARVPLLDHIFIEKVFGHQSKKLLRKILAEDLPACVTSRKKEGFNMPLKKWLKEERGFRDMLFDETDKLCRLSEVKFDADYIRSLYASHVSGKEDNAYKLYNLLVFAMWRNSRGNN